MLSDLDFSFIGFRWIFVMKSWRLDMGLVFFELLRIIRIAEY